MAVIGCLLLAAIISATNPMNCKDESGNDVSWWVALKQPKGTSYVYADVHSPTLKLSPYVFADATKGALSFTLNQIYTANHTQPADASAFVFYNDQLPTGQSSSSSRGHTKGAVGMTQAGGFWLVHSIPGFPNYVSTHNTYPGYDAATDYGQSLLCMSLSLSDLDLVGIQFYYNFPYYYDWNMPSWVPANMLSSVTKSSHTTQAVSNVEKIGTSFGQTFMSFAKTSNWNSELYENLVAPYFNSDLYVETWMNGVNPDPTYCKNATIAYNVMNIRNVTAGGVTWTETNDHSKWCITTNNALTVVCIGDINRQQSQNTRPGGTVCFSHSSMYTSFKGTIAGADHCP